ncbi:MAG: sensor histidine kinase [Roseiarcus sp.]|jgi:signal transduction histidine kinase
MKKFNSLTLRLTLFGTLGFVLSYYLVFPTFAILNEAAPAALRKYLRPGGTWSDFAYFKARDVVLESLRRGADGVPYIEPTPQLRAYLAENPKFRFAVFKSYSGAALLGSDPKLVAAVEGLGSCHIAEQAGPPIADDPDPASNSSLTELAAPMGKLPLALYGYTFHWSDLLYYLSEPGPFPIFPYEGPMLFSALALAWLAVRSGLAPLKGAAQKVAGVDMNSLDQRITTRDIPVEVVPFVDAVNATLARLDIGVAAQCRFTANAAHELRTPLAILRARLEGPEEATFKSDLMRDVSRIGAIVEQLLATARLSESQDNLKQRIDLAQTVWQVVADYAALLLDRDRRIELEDPETPVFVAGDRRAIESVVTNLVDNALRAEPVGGTVLLRVSNSGVIEVIDHGEGIAPEDRDAIFEPFWRKSGASSGAGLGLSIAKELTHKLGGRIWVEETPGGGATFKLSFSTISQ